MSTTEPSRRVALVADAGFYVGPPIARLLAARGHDLVIGNPAAGLVEELRAAGATVEVVDGVRSYDFGPVIWFWIGSSVVSMLLAASLWRTRLRD